MDSTLFIRDCIELYAKLRYDGDRLESSEWSVYASFDFLLTAWHLNREWLERKDRETAPRLAIRKRKKAPDQMKDVMTAIGELANGQKHFGLDARHKDNQITSKTHAREIASWDAYFLHGPMIGTWVGASYYNMWSLRFLVLQYFEWLFDDNVAVDTFPEPIIEHFNACVVS